MEPVFFSIWDKFTSVVSFRNPVVQVVPDAHQSAIETHSKPNMAAHVRSELLSGRSFTMSHAELICRILGGLNYDDPAPHEEAVRLAGRWIQNGGTRIFSSRWQCLAELIRNAHDACLPVDQQVGEFGIGFFGVFGVMEADSRVEMLTWTEDRELPGYRMVIGQNNVCFSPLRSEDKAFRPPTGHGTRITLHGVSYTIEEIKPYIHFFDFAKLAHDAVKIEYGCTNDPITVADRGTGVTLRTAIESMLVPTSSSKPRRKNHSVPSACPVELVQWLGKSENNASYFLVAVQGSICMRKRLPEPLSVMVDGKPADLLIRMPLGTRQALSRDEILIDEDENDFETRCLFQTIVEVLKNGCEGDGDLRLFCTLYKAFRGWEAATSSQHMRMRFSRFARKVFMEVYAADPGLIAVRPEHFDRLKEILQGSKGRLIAIDPILVDHHFGRLQKLVRDGAMAQLNEASSELERKACQGLVIKEMTVCFIPDARLPKTSRGVPMICTLNVKNTLFAPRSLLDLALESSNSLCRLQEEIIYRYAEDGMPLPQPVSADQNEQDLTPMIIIRSEPDETRHNKKLRFPEHRGYAFVGNPAWVLANIDADRQDRFINELRKRQDDINALWHKYSGVLDEKDFFKGSHEECRQRLNELLFALLRKRHLLPTRTIQDFLDGHLADVAFKGILALGEKVLWPLPENSRTRDLSLLFAVLMTMEKNIPLFKFFRSAHPNLSTHQGKLPVLWMDSGDHSDLERIVCRMRELQWARLHGQSYARCFWTPQEKELIPEAITKQIMSLTFAQTGMAPPLKDRLELFIESLSSMYDRYLTVPAKNIGYDYGNTRFTIELQKPEDGGEHWENAGKVLKLLDVQSSLRLIDFSLEFFAKQTGCDGSEKGAYRYRNIVLPTLLDVNPIGLAAKLLLDLKFDSTTVSLLIEESRDASDFISLSILFSCYHNNNHDSIFKLSGQELQRLHPDLRFFIQEFIQRRLSESNLHDWYNRIDVYTTSKSLEIKAFKGPLYHSFCDYAKTIRKPPPSEVHQIDAFLSGIQRAGFDKAHPISLKKLTQCCFTESKELHRLLEEGQLPAALELVAAQKEFIPLRKISQNVSSSTEQSSLASFFGECIQNSCDAIQAFAKHPEADRRRDDWGAIDLSVGIMGGDSLVLAIRDRIGFPDLKTLLLDLPVPENSHKNAEENVGQMGNGFAKVFMKARLVTVSTRIIGANRKGYEISFQPIRIEGVVEDVSIRIYETRKGEEGTLIRVLMPPSTEDQVRMDARHALFFLRDTLGSAQLPQVRTQTRQVCIPLRLQTRNGTFILLNEPDPNRRPLVCASPGHPELEVRKLPTSGQPSIVTTGGIPFLPLSVFCTQYTLLHKSMLRDLNHGFALLLPVGMYEPVQSRSKLQLKSGKEKLVAQILHDAFYMATWENEKKDPSTLFLHGWSKGEIGQLILRPQEDPFEHTLKIAGGSYSFDSPNWMAMHQPAMLRNCIWKSFAAIIEAQIEGQTEIAEILSGDREHNIKMQGLIDAAYGELSSEPTLKLANKHIKKLIRLSEERQSTIRRLFENWQINLCANASRYFEGGNPETKDLQFFINLIKHAVIPWMSRKIESGSVMYFYPSDVRAAHSFFGESALERMGAVLAQGAMVAAIPFILLGMGLQMLGSAAGKLKDAVKTKVPDPSQCLPAIHSVQEIPALQADLSQLRRLADFAIQTYFNCIWDVLDNGEPVPKVRFVNCLDCNARYVPLKNIIEINLKNWPLSKLFHLMEAIAAGNMEQVFDKMKDLIMPSQGYSGLFNHELEHARTRDSCVGDGHGFRESVLGEQVNFNAAATALYQMAARNGAIERFISDIRQFLKSELGEDHLMMLQGMIEMLKIWEGDLAESFRRAIIQDQETPNLLVQFDDVVNSNY